MAEITINEGWDKIKIKLKRKYRDLRDEDIQFNPGNEEKLITDLMRLINQNRDYVVFMLKKFQHNMGNNRL